LHLQDQTFRNVDQEPLELEDKHPECVNDERDTDVKYDGGFGWYGSATWYLDRWIRPTSKILVGPAVEVGCGGINVFAHKGSVSDGMHRIVCGGKIQTESDVGKNNIDLCTGKRTRTATGMWCPGWTAARPPTPRTSGWLRPRRRLPGRENAALSDKDIDRKACWAHVILVPGGGESVGEQVNNIPMDKEDFKTSHTVSKELEPELQVKPGHSRHAVKDSPGKDKKQLDFNSLLAGTDAGADQVQEEHGVAVHDQDEGHHHLHHQEDLY
jgi:hypothetical protein